MTATSGVDAGDDGDVCRSVYLSCSSTYLIFVISFTQAIFFNPNILHPKITTNFPKICKICSFSRSIWTILHRTEFFYTGTACGACDKYEVWEEDMLIGSFDANIFTTSQPLTCKCYWQSSSPHHHHHHHKFIIIIFVRTCQLYGFMHCMQTNS